MFGIRTLATFRQAVFRLSAFPAAHGWSSSPAFSLLCEPFGPKIAKPESRIATHDLFQSMCDAASACLLARPPPQRPTRILADGLFRGDSP
jgi:hypothetical protein